MSDQERQQHGAVLDRAYAFIDGVIGAAIERQSPGDLLLVVSGFGMQPVGPLKHLAARVLRDPDVSGTHENAPDGFMLAFGTPVTRGPQAARLDRRRDADHPLFPGRPDRPRHGRLRPLGPLHADFHGSAADHVHSVTRAVNNRRRSCFELLLVALLIGSAVSPAAPDPVDQTFKVPAAGEAVAVIHASCERCDWGVEGREAAVVRILVDGKYSQHLALALGAEVADYHVSLGAIARGRSPAAHRGRSGPVVAAGRARP